jgi:hypothetical protein
MDGWAGIIPASRSGSSGFRVDCKAGSAQKGVSSEAVDRSCSAMAVHRASADCLEQSAESYSDRIPHETPGTSAADHVSADHWASGGCMGRGQAVLFAV